MPRKNAKRDEQGRYITDPNNPPVSKTREYINEYNRNRKELNHLVRVNWEDKNHISYSEKRKRYRQEHKGEQYENQRKSHLKVTYGITPEQYNELSEKQGHKCFICEKHQSKLKHKLCVDHNHETKEIRGLLCKHCNQIIIGRQKDPNIFYRAALYLEQGHTGLFVPKKKRKSRPPREKIKPQDIIETREDIFKEEDSS